MMMTTKDFSFREKKNFDRSEMERGSEKNGCPFWREAIKLAILLVKHPHLAEIIEKRKGYTE